jgi:glycosyltransferase involved in cell wall biosynthesis
MRVCHLVPSLEERHGGPSKSVRALGDAQAGSGESVELLSTFEPGRPVPVFDDGDKPAACVRMFPRETPLWLCRSTGLRDHLASARYDCVHHHALWLLTLRYAHEAARRADIPLIVSPRGMLSGWALAHRRWRKRLAEILVHPGAFAHAAGWHATSPEEAGDIRQLGFKQPVCIAPNGVAVPSPEELAAARVCWHAVCPATRTRPVALFYSRFHQKKRLRELLDLWLASPRGDWLLLIAGLPEGYSVAEIDGWIAAAGARERAAVFDGTDRPPPYAVASLFLLPSHSENFGLVIAEALAAGVPALVTDTTPWRGLAAHEAGWCVPWTDYAATLDATLLRPAGDLSTMGARGRAWMAREFSWERAGRLLLEFYTHLRRG